MDALLASFPFSSYSSYMPPFFRPENPRVPPHAHMHLPHTPLVPFHLLLVAVAVAVAGRPAGRLAGRIFLLTKAISVRLARYFRGFPLLPSRRQPANEQTRAKRVRGV